MSAARVPQDPRSDVEMGTIAVHKPESQDEVATVQGDISQVPEPDVGISPTPVQVDDAQVHVDKLSFFRNYDQGRSLNVDASIGGYPATIFGFWKLPKEADGCNNSGRGTSKPGHFDGNCKHPFTLYAAAKEIAYLLKCRSLDDTVFWKVAEVEWKKQAEDAQKVVDAKDGKVNGLISEIYQLVGLAAAFQGLLITAAAQLSTSKDRCSGRLWWFLTLSLFATAVTAKGVHYKVGLVGVFKKTLKSATSLLNERLRLFRKLTLTEGPGQFDLKPLPKQELGRFKKFQKERVSPTYEYSATILVCLIAFGVICGFTLAFSCK